MSLVAPIMPSIITPAIILRQLLVLLRTPVLGAGSTYRQNYAPNRGSFVPNRYGKVRLRVATLMYSPLRPVGRGSLQATRSQ